MITRNLFIYKNSIHQILKILNYKSILFFISRINEKKSHILKKSKNIFIVKQNTFQIQSPVEMEPMYLCYTMYQKYFTFFKYTN